MINPAAVVPGGGPGRSVGPAVVGSTALGGAPNGAASVPAGSTADEEEKDLCRGLGPVSLLLCDAAVAGMALEAAALLPIAASRPLRRGSEIP